jgi:hypothetical protein
MNRTWRNQPRTILPGRIAAALCTLAALAAGVFFLVGG